MSRYGVAYKPGGSIARDVGVTLKMQRQNKSVSQDCPICPSPLTDLVAVWLDANENPLSDPLIHVSVWTNHFYLDGGGDIFVPNNGIFLKMARLVNSDWQTKGVSTELLIDQAQAIWEATSWTGVDSQPLFAWSGSTCSVSYNYAGLNNGGSGVLTITPSFMGAALHFLQLDISVREGGA